MRNVILNAPVESGQFMSLKDCGETSFASGAMGRGAAARNTNGRIIAPFSGRVLKIFRNAMEIISNDGIKLFIQVGDSSFYEEACKENQSITANQILAYFNINKVVMFTVKNSLEFGDITFQRNGQYTVKPQSVESNRKNNSSREENGMAERKFTILGEMRSGKTCYLLGMYSEMTAGVGGYSIIAPNPDEDSDLTRRYQRLTNKKQGIDRFPLATNVASTYNFNLQYGLEKIMSFEWIDYPGNFVDAAQRDIANPDYVKVEQSINESSTLFICMDGENLVDGNVKQKIKRVRNSCAKRINPYILKLADKLNGQGKKLPPVGIIVTKWDLCLHSTTEDDLREIVEESFNSLFTSKDSIVAIIPVSLGETIMDDSVSGELDPINIELPILYGIRFALRDQIKQIDQQIDNINADTYRSKNWRDKEADRWFFWRDDDLIRSLEADMRNNRARNVELEKIKDAMKRNRGRLERDLEDLQSVFYNGEWHKGISK